ncbi:MAG: penicillin acylase family protein [bacterium]
MKLASLIILLIFVTIAFALITNTYAQFEDITLRAPDGTNVSTNRDSFGVPHIVAESEAGVFFGQGFAVAQDRLLQLEQHRRVAEGKLAEWFGVLMLENDKEVHTMFYTQEERIQQFKQLPSEFQTMLQAYSDGINTYLDSMAVNPVKYKPLEFSLLYNMERWNVYKTVAVIQYLTRIFGQAGGEELERLSELQSNGQAWFDLNRPINDVNAPTTIRENGSVSFKKWSYSGMHVRDEIIQSIRSKREEVRSQSAKLGLPLKFGSFAVLISPSKSNAGDVMLLGAPQMGAPKENEPQIAHEVELDCPTFHVGGMTIAGVPAVIIGHTELHAWTLTSGVSDNSDVYVDSTMDSSFGKYFHNGQWRDFEVVQDTIFNGVTEVPFTHYRTVHGPVFGEDLDNHQVYSMKMTFWNQELDMMIGIYQSIKARTLEEFEVAAALIPFSFNLFYAGQDQKIKYWHVGKYQDRSDGVDPRLPHKGDGSEEWGGFIKFADLPSADNTHQDYFVNWNNKPVSWWNNGDNIPWAGSTNLTMRVSKMEAFVGPINGFTYENLKDVPRQIDDHGTYQQAIEFTGTEIIDENIVPPGQSGFINSEGQKSPHFSDQWPLHMNWQFKDMEFGQFTVSVEIEEPRPENFTLHQNYPNPFNPVTTIAYELPQSGDVLIEVYNLHGQLVQKLVNKGQPAGFHQVVWDAQGLASGVYIYQITTGNFSAVRKSILLK